MKLNVLKKISAVASAALLCGVVHAQTLSFTSDQTYVLSLAAELYPDLFGSHGAIKSAQGYTYLTFDSGVTVGFKDGALYVAGGPFGAAIQNKGTVSQVTTSLTNLKNSVSVTPTADMTSLFTFAAQAYPSLFSDGSPFQITADGYLYKSFASGLYAAIKNGTVYVKGGSYGNVYTSVGALNSVLSKLQTAVNGGNNPGGGTTIPSIPSGNYNLTVSGTVTIAGPIAVSQPFSFTLNGIPAPNVSDQNDIKQAFTNALSNSSGVTITNFSYVTKSNTADLVEFDVTVSAQISQSGVNLGYTYALNYKYTK